MQVMFGFTRVVVGEKALRMCLRTKTTHAEMQRELHKKNKLLFGKLLETRKEKIAREKREKTLVSKKNVDENTQKPIDTELKWLGPLKPIKLTSWRSAKFKKLIVKNGDVKNTDAEENFSVPPHGRRSAKDSNSRDNNEMCLTETRTNDARIVNDTTASPSSDFNRMTDNDVSTVVSSSGSTSSQLPLEIVINKMTSFPYLDDSKIIMPRIPGIRQILSISSHLEQYQLSIPSVTRILSNTMSAEAKLNLELWKQRMIMQLGEEGFRKYSQELLLHGKQFHSSIQNYLTRKVSEVPTSVELAWQSIEHVVKEIYDVQAIESHAIHSKLYYRGIIDCVACYRGNLCVIDWKKSDKPKKDIAATYDAPLQVASYIGALNSDKNYDFEVRNGLVVVGYTNGDPATVHEIDPLLLNKYWKLWLRRLQQYHIEISNKSNAGTRLDNQP